MSCEQFETLVSGNIFVRKVRLPHAGHAIPGHRHHFDHTTIVVTGRVRAEIWDEQGVELVKEFEAPSHFLVRKDKHHRLTALVDGTEAWCVFAHRDPQGEVVQEYAGWDDAHLPNER